MSLFGILFDPRRKATAMPGPSPAEGPLESPERKARVRRAASLLADLAVEDAHSLIWGVTKRFAAHVADLPASEKHHHAQSYGLLDHSLEVAELALRAALSRHFTGDTRAYPEDQEYCVPRLRYAAWFLGLCHDAGKVASVTVHSGREVWNPYVEPLEEFYRRHGRRGCRVDWIPGRGLDAHTWHNAYLMGLFLTGPVGAYLGRRLTSQLLAQETPEAQEVLALVQEADRKSTRAWLTRPQPNLPIDEIVGEAPEVLVGKGEYIDRVPAILAQALSKEALRANILGGHLYVGKEWVLFRYPLAVQTLALLIREGCGHEYARARAFTASEAGARELAGDLHERRLLLTDSESDLWKLKARIRAGSEYDVADAVVIRRSVFGTSLANLEVFAGTIDLARADERAVMIEDWRAPEASLKPVEQSDRQLAATDADAKPEKTVASATSAPSDMGTPSAIVTPRKFISGELLFDDIRQAILDGTIPSNQWNKPCFVLEDVTYLASPLGFVCLCRKGLYTRNPKREVNVYLDALAKIPAVRKKPGGKVLHGIAVRPGARGLWVVAFDTKGLFRDARELARVGYWTESPIRELTEEEMRSGSPHAAAGAATSGGANA